GERGRDGGVRPDEVHGDHGPGSGGVRDDYAGGDVPADDVPLGRVVDPVGVRADPVGRGAVEEPDAEDAVGDRGVAGGVGPDVVPGDDVPGRARPGDHDPVVRVAGDDVPLRRVVDPVGVGADHVGRRAEVGDAPGVVVGDGERAGDVGADQVALDHVAGDVGPGQVDAADLVAGDDVPQAAGPADPVVAGRLADAHPLTGVGQGGGAGRVGADEVPHDRCAHRPDPGQAGAVLVVAGDQVARHQVAGGVV